MLCWDGFVSMFMFCVTCGQANTNLVKRQHLKSKGAGTRDLTYLAYGYGW